jgi:hypothetical protein
MILSLVFITPKEDAGEGIRRCIALPRSASPSCRVMFVGAESDAARYISLPNIANYVQAEIVKARPMKDPSCIPLVIGLCKSLKGEFERARHVIDS